MCDPITAVVAGSAILGAGTSLSASSKAAKASKATNAQNAATAAADAQRSEQQFNKANQKSPDIAAMFARNQEAAKSGMGATFLTGPAGVAPSALTLGKSTLLGG